MGRKSVLTSQDCLRLTTEFGNVQKQLWVFAARGFQKEGFDNDFMAMVSILDLQKVVNGIVDRLHEQEEKGNLEKETPLQRLERGTGRIMKVGDNYQVVEPGKVIDD